MKYIIAIIAAATMSGCATIPDTTGGAAGVVKHYKPEYAGMIDQISDVLVGRRINPVEGFAREERWYLKGEEVNPSDLKLEVLYRNNYQINSAYMSPANKPEGEVSDAELKAEIEAILKASGVAE